MICYTHVISSGNPSSKVFLILNLQQSHGNGLFTNTFCVEKENIIIIHLGHLQLYIHMYISTNAYMVRYVVNMFKQQPVYWRLECTNN